MIDSTAIMAWAILKPCESMGNGLVDYDINDRSSASLLPLTRYFHPS